MIYFELFWSFFQIGILSFGGGYAALPLIQNQVVDIRGWLTLQEFTDVLTISQMTPGPIALNAASFIGTRLAGPLGSIVATVSDVLPALIIVMFLAWFYFKYRSMRVMQGALSGLRPAVVALIASAGLSILFTVLFGNKEFPSSLDNIKLYALIVFILGFIVIRIRKLNPLAMILGCGVITVVLNLIGLPIGV
ncbi:MAG: chromate transporter [Sphaerochaetaceae bacterium]|jgi:chromate transporter|nr:chromate transporter [Sphaerochaetaceae bacterium]NLO59454.1 chromate transporter [Spirochaetales bacterium]MDD2406333.1 chromate transporter [Sphaerochaetaceae bacterium]MDD3671355.1 chromate transporter [Sphaerochaetaceae bacterium]MDD4259124.1 chromate transporter [Sphaerochaetaceae bacterium]